MRKNNATLHREKIKAEFWASDVAWTGEPPEKGWFRAPRTLPLILTLLSSKKVTGSKFDPTSVYLELLARHRDTGIVEMAMEGEHSYAAGYIGPRAVRTWQERMKILLDLGFIKSSKSGNQQYKYVLIVHPTIVVKRLHDQGKIDQAWWDTYRQRQIETKELTYAQLVAAPEPEKIIKTVAAKKTKKAS
jgi:hypothetical protein